VETLIAGFVEAMRLLFNLDSQVAEITILSLKVSAVAVLISLCLGIPSAIALAGSSFKGRTLIISLINTGMALPPVLAGLIVYLFLSRNGPLGYLNLIYTPSAIITAQALIAYPVVTGLTLAALQSIDPAIATQALGLGATRLQVWLLLLREGRFSALAALMAAFGAAISEVGAVLMVGGDIKGQTRVLTTAVVFETRVGNFERAMALGLILLLVSFMINSLLTSLQQRAGKR
jgi:tungstate transport system permease protein